MIRVQRKIAQQVGCAFWDARAVMGGEGSFNRWIEASPKLDSTDLIHLTKAGLALVGNSLADALLEEYRIWRLSNPEVGWVPVDVDDRDREPSKKRLRERWESWQPVSDETVEDKG